MHRSLQSENAFKGQPRAKLHRVWGGERIEAPSPRVRGSYNHVIHETGRKN